MAEKQKLKKFTAYADRLLPIETAYLVRQSRHLAADRRDIIKRLHERVSDPRRDADFDLSIDKRKYSITLRWIQDNLDRIDVDKKLIWINDCHSQILLDVIRPATENELLQSLGSTDPQSYYFIRYYDMLTEYRHYLQIRMRYDQYRAVDAALERWRFNYQKSRLAYAQIQQATADIIGSSDDGQKEAIQWKQWLTNTFDDQDLDGLTRYMAFVRLSFVCLRYNMLSELRQLLYRLEAFFEGGKHYSRRLLMNYYDNMLVLYDRLGDREKARHYGYLSIRDHHPDSIIYRNNLVNVLLKDRRFEEGLTIIEQIDFKISSTKNFHSAVGFVSNHVRCLSKVDKVPQAITKGRVFLEAYHKLILKYRWHRFFASYLGALLMGGRLKELIRVVNKYNLVDKERGSSQRSSGGVQVISIYYHTAMRMVGAISHSEYRQKIEPIVNTSSSMTLDRELLRKVSELMEGNK